MMLTTAFYGMCFCGSHFADEKTKLYRGKVTYLPKITKQWVTCQSQALKWRQLAQSQIFLSCNLAMEPK